jgi:hypothetical protein
VSGAFETERCRDGVARSYCRLGVKRVSEATSTLIGSLIGQTTGALVLSFINAWVTSWRAKALRSWRIPYRSAYFVSVKAVLIALVAGVLAAHSIDFVFDHFASARPGLARSTAVLLGVVAWWFAHCSALMKLQVRRIVVWPKDARAISASVFGFVTVILTVSVAVLLMVFFLISLFTKSTLGQ